MNKMQFFKHTINYHVTQVNLEANTTEEFGDWIDQYPPTLQPRVQTIAATQKNNIVIVKLPNAKQATVATKPIPEDKLQVI